jgi:molybdopterin-guanine dinucleotide biosynthesis protein A
MGRPKQDIVLAGGQTMLGRVVQALEGVCQRIVLVGGRAPEFMNVAGHAGGIEHVADLRPGLGPLGGIEALLASGLDAEYLACPCDVPLVDGRLLRKLVEPDGEHERLATIVRLEGHDEAGCLPARISAEALVAVRELLDCGERAVWRLMKRLEARIVTVGADLGGGLANVNTPEDLAGLERPKAQSTKPRAQRHRFGAEVREGD